MTAMTRGGNRHRPTNEVTARLPANVHKLLGQAAARRHISIEELAEQIICGTVLHGSIHKATAFNLRIDDAQSLETLGASLAEV